LGVRRIVPLFSHKSQIKLTPERAAKKIEHWQRIIIAACGQCERNVLPTLDSPLAINAFLKQPSNAYKLALHPNAATPFKHLTPPAIGQEIILLIGPESGLDDNEINAAAAAGYTTMLLGPRILRTESAGLAAIAALQTVWGDF
jgi:16S rRNA (uracil1498-N3)-methyltransferase